MNAIQSKSATFMVIERGRLGVLEAENYANVSKGEIQIYAIIADRFRLATPGPVPTFDKHTLQALLEH